MQQRCTIQSPSVVQTDETFTKEEWLFVWLTYHVTEVQHKERGTKNKEENTWANVDVDTMVDVLLYLQRQNTLKCSTIVSF